MEELKAALTPRIFHPVGRRRPYLVYKHHTNLETIWTIIPCVILFIIAIPSFSLAMALDEEINPWLWVKVIGNQ